MDGEAKRLDARILSFIRKHADQPASDKNFETLALQIFDYQFRKNTNYRKFCLIEGKAPGKVKKWQEIPAMPTAGFKELVLATFPIKKAVKVFKTSGTTHENRGAHFFDTLKLYEAAIIPPFRQYLLPATKTRHQGVGGSARDVWRTSAGLRDFLFCFLMSSPKESPNSSLSHMMGVVNRVFAKNKGKFYVQKDQIQYENLLKDLKQTRKKVFILSTAFALKAFLDYLRNRKISLNLPSGSRLMETGGFKGRTKEVSKDKLYAECNKTLGIDRNYCVSEYGMTELSSQFYDTTLRDKVSGSKREPFKEGPAWIRTLVIDPKTGKEAAKGKRGVLRHFDLANRGSVLAIQTEDLGRRASEGFELLGRASGAELRGCSLSYEEFLTSP